MVSIAPGDIEMRNPLSWEAYQRQIAIVWFFVLFCWSKRCNTVIFVLGCAILAECETLDRGSEINLLEKKHSRSF